MSILAFFGSIGTIILVDLVLSGDNALVIAACMAGLPERQRWIAVLTGGGGAIVLRLLCAFLVSLILAVPFLKAIGGIALLVIAVRLLMERNKQDERERNVVEQSLLAALVSILIADLTMGFDNIIALGALAAGHLVLLAIGLCVSISLVLLASAVIARVMSKLPWLIDGASLVLGWTAGQMILSDETLRPVWQSVVWSGGAVPVLALALLIVVNGYFRVRDRRIAREEMA